MKGLKLSFPFQEHSLLRCLSTQKLRSTFYSSFRSSISKHTHFELAVQNAYDQPLVCKCQQQYHQMHEPRAWSYVTLNIYSTKSYATGFGKMRYSDNAVVVIEPDVNDQIKKKGYTAHGNDSRRTQDTPRAQKAAGYLFPADIWQQSTCTSSHLHCKVNNRHINHLKSQTVHLTMPQRAGD